MDDQQVSWTALLTAYARAYHATHDNPKIFDDFLADPLFSQQERAFIEKGLAESLEFFDPERAAACPDQATALAWYMRVQGGPVTLSRSRYTEDCLATAIGHGVEQYVILGAGMDTFAFRHPELLGQLHVFEVDQLATQANKRQRLASLGWELPAHLHFVAVDFSKESIHTALKRSGFSPQKLSFFSWLGVTYYLSQSAVRATLGALADLALPGSTIIFDYLDQDAFHPERAARRMQRMQQRVQHMGEPLEACFNPSRLANDLVGIGWQLKENLSPADIEARFFREQADGYHAFEHFHFAQAVVTGSQD